MPCWNCGFENPSGAKFCVNCGKPQHAVCPECGAKVPEGAKFCLNCGTLLSAPAPPESVKPVLTAETRRVITVIFTDLVGSTGLTERLDPEDARDVVGKFYSVVQHAVERFDGTVANLLGDAVLAVFGLPTAHEDDPERAVLAGLAIREAMPALNEHLRAAKGVELDVRVGINTGEVVAASGSTFDRDFLISDAVTTAARLQQTAAAGTVVIGERTYRLTRDVIEYHELPPMDVKGKAEALLVWEAVGPLVERPDVWRDMAPLVGRDGELGVLRHHFQRAVQDSRIHVVTVFGDPGVGKSRLLREFLAQVRDSELRPQVLRGRSVAFGGQIGYHALIDILRFQAGLLDTDPPDVMRTKLASWTAQALPKHPQVLEGLLLTFGVQNGVSGDPAMLRRRLFEAWEIMIREMASAQPVLLALEDLHWADDGALDLIERIGSSPQPIPLVIICLTRPDLLERRPAWGGGRRTWTTINLEPLQPQEAEQLAAALGRQGLGPELRRAIVDRAEGNPLFVEELVRMLQEGNAPGMTIPDTVQAVLAARIDRLPTEERRVLQAGAVIGRTFWPSAIVPIAGLPAEEMAGAIDTLIAREMVLPRANSAIEGEREYAFRHILTRDVAYSMLPRSQRQRAHAEAARWLERRMGARVEEIVEVLAEHLRLAGDDARAAAYLHRAGNKARRLYANADAIQLFTQALQAASAASLPFEQLAEMRRDRGEVFQLLGNYRESLDDFERGLALAQQTGNAGLEALLENRIGLIHHRLHDLDEAQRHFTRAAALARVVEDQPLLGQTLVDLANIVWDRGALRPTDAALIEGLTLLRATGDKAGLARGLNMLCMSHLGAGEGVEATRAAQEASLAAHEAGDKSKEATSLSYLSVVGSYLGTYEQSIELGLQALALAEEIGDRRRVAFTRHFLARSRIGLGRLGEAIDDLKESQRLARELAPGHLPWTFFHLGFLYEEVGAIELARAEFAAAAEIDLRTTTWWQPLLACKVGLARLSGDVIRLDQILREMPDQPWDDFIPAQGDTLRPIGESLLAMERIDELRRYLAQVGPGVMKFGSPPYLAGLDLLQAHLAVRDGNPAQALTHLDAALQWCARSGYVIGKWRVLELRLQISGQNDDRTQLRTALEQLAAALPADLGAIFLANPRVAEVFRGGEGGI